MEIAIIVVVMLVVSSLAKLKEAGNKNNSGSQRGGRKSGPAPEQPWQQLLGGEFADIAKSFKKELGIPDKSNSTSKHANNQAKPAQVYKPKPNGTLSQRLEMSQTSIEIAKGESNVVDRGKIIGGSIEGAGFEGMSTYEGYENFENFEVLDGFEDIVTETAPQANAKTQGIPVPKRPEINIVFNQDTLVQAIVMNEILTRPIDRKRRWPR